jgi:hypothetical protein
MAKHGNWSDFTRPQWGGAASDTDIHIEEHLGIVDASFAYASQLAHLANVRTLRGTNQVRLDRVGAATVQGRRSGDELETTPVRNDKLNMTVDTVLYVRNEFDKFDQWTANPDLRREIGREHGYALARQFDNACIGQLQKSAAFTAPAHLKPAFHDGILENVTLTSQTGPTAADAKLLADAHRVSIEQLIDRDLGDQLSSEGLTLVAPDIFTILLQHDKLMNVQFGAGEGNNNFAQARIGYMNGVRVMETPRFAKVAVTASPLGASHNLTATEIKRKIITFIPSLTLIAPQVHPVAAKYWEDERKFGHVLDTYQSYNIGIRRGDAVAAVAVTPA